MEEHRTRQTTPIEVEKSPSATIPLESETKQGDISEIHRSPFRLLVITIVAIFFAEVVAMIVVYALGAIPYYLITLIDAGIMLILIFPVLYFLSFHPLIRQMQKSWQAEESLRQSRELQEKFFDSINTLIAYMDRDFNFIRVNDAYARADGRTPDFFVGKNHFALYPHPENHQIFQYVVETGEPFLAFERPFEYPENPERGITYWDWNLQPVKGADGRVEGLVLSLLNVTERKLAQEANRQLSRIVEQTEDTVVVTNCEGIIEYVNPAFERLTGYTKQEAVGKTPRLLKSGIHDGYFYEELWDTILKGEVFQSEIANRKKNGDVFYEVKTITPLRDAHGNITHFVATGKDITEHKYDEEELRKAYDELELRVQKRTEELRIANSDLEEEIIERNRIEQALRESEMRSQRAEEIAHLGNWELDLINNRLIWSDEVYRIFGLQPKEFAASYEAFLEAVHPDDRAAVDRAYTGSVRDGQDGYEIEHRVIKRSNGEVRIVHEKCEHFRNEIGQITRSVGMVHDITERKQAERRLAYLASFPERNPNPICEVDFEGQIRYANEVASSILPDLAARGLTHELLAGLKEIVATFSDGETNVLSRDVMLGERIYQLSFYFLSEDRLIRIYATDITERKKMEEALRCARDELELRVQKRTRELAVANQELLREIAEREEIERVLRTRTTAMEAAASGIVITDRQGDIQWINPAFVQISGYETSELIGQNMSILRSGQHDVDYYRQLWDTILAGKVWRGETTNRRKNDSLYIEEQTITPVRDHHGEIVQFIAVKQDITERKKAEKEIWERDQKEKILTQTIYTMQLDIARDLHDTLGQNISYLRMKLDYLAERKIRKQAEMQLELQAMARAANESYDLMRGTLAVLQSENSTNLFRLFTRYAQQIEERANFKISFFSQGEPKFISAKRMRQLFYIFREILNNIEKHAKASEVCMELSWNRDDLTLAVSDNGCGFDVHQVQYGSHYGLKFMRERVELLNGVLTIQSAAGSGTNIKLQVPYE